MVVLSDDPCIVSPWAWCAGHAFSLISIVTCGFVSDPVLWQIVIIGAGFAKTVPVEAKSNTAVKTTSIVRILFLYVNSILHLIVIFCLFTFILIHCIKIIILIIIIMLVGKCKK